MPKPDCYACVHRRPVPGDAHSSCDAVPEDKAMFYVAGILNFGASGGVVGDPHGIRNGWFMWPLSYDPVWLRACPFFEEPSAKP